MGLFRKFFGFLGFPKDDDHDDHNSKDDSDDHPAAGQSRPPNFRVREAGIPRKGFSVPVQVVQDRPQLGPVLVPSTSGDGGLQGLGWYAKHLRIDEDGDVANKFLDEVSSQTPAAFAADHHKATARFKLKHDTRPVKVRQQLLSSDGKFQQVVEHQGKLQLV
ncbi:uncharacterized protein LOC123910316 [Trifolium pratense]|uniref:uncharacterized protein LOC123910316 n=1 Tax=Trifolium pratense TaxID=57577 RepID=UPI001E696681|nr:uncharacterized protein LOC123910316 [Trifolium pratense]